jgi:hypothetical protein
VDPEIFFSDADPALALLSGSKPDSSSACSKKKILDFTRFVLRAQDCLNFINVFCYQVVKRKNT